MGRAGTLAEVDFSTWTRAGRVRHLSFKGLRGISQREAVAEPTGARGVAKPTCPGLQAEPPRYRRSQIGRPGICAL